jgi:hypothetical protein
MVAVGTLALVVACSSGGPAAAPPAAPSPAAAKPAATAAPTAAPAAAPAPAEPTVLQMTDLQITSQAGYYIAQEKGYLREQGIQLEYVRGNPADMLPLVVSGQVEIGAGAISAGLFNAFARGVPLKMVADAGDNLANASAGGVVFRKDLFDSGAVRDAADLRGRKIASATQASAPNIALDKYLSSAGLTMADLETVILTFPDILSAFENKGVDAAYYQEPFTTIGIERGLIVRGPKGARPVREGDPLRPAARSHPERADDRRRPGVVPGARPPEPAHQRAGVRGHLVRRGGHPRARAGRALNPSMRML